MLPSQISLKFISESKEKDHPLGVESYPCDSRLLTVSSVYKRSRHLFCEMGGLFRPRFLSVARALSSQDLLSLEIEYTPLEAELKWAVRNPQQIADSASYWHSLLGASSSLFHEQNHRIVWPLMPALPIDPVGRRQWFHFAESLVMTLDMVLASELGPESCYYEELKIIYRDHTDFKASSEAYMIFFWSSYLLLEGYSEEEVRGALGSYLEEQGVGFAVSKAFELSDEFIASNREWQRLHLEDYSLRLTQMQQEWTLPDFSISSNPWEFQVEMDFVSYVVDQFLEAP